MISSYETANLWDIVSARISATPDASAITAASGSVSYADLGQQVDRFAAGLIARGVVPGQRVAGCLTKSVAGLAGFLAVAKIGAIYTPINPGFTPHEVSNILEDARPALVVSDLLTFLEQRPEAIPIHDILADGALRSAPPTAPGGRVAAAMLFTSGTTGRPKGAMMTHFGIINTFTEFNRIWDITHSDKLLHVLPTFHAHGLMMAVLCPLFSGAEIVLMEKFDVEAVIEMLPSITAMMAVPTIWNRLADHPGFTREQTRTLRLATSGSAPLSPTLYDRVLAQTGITLLDRYGSTEAGMVTANPVGRSKRGSVGQVLAGVDLLIAGDDGSAVAKNEVGRVKVKGANTFLGYWSRPELDAATWSADGYFDTGDFGFLDDDGYLHIAGRDKDMIISGGFNVYPREVEIALESVQGVAEAVVFGLPHPDFGEGVAAAVLLETGTALKPADIASEVARLLTAYKRPKSIFVVDHLPRNSMGKVLRADLVERFSKTFQRI